MPYRQRNNVFYPASAITLQKQRAKRQAAGYGSGSLDAFTEEERRSVQVAEGVLPDHIRKKMHELLGEEETPRAEISDGAKRQGRAMEEWWARQEARSTRAVRPAEPAIAAAAQATKSTSIGLIGDHGDRLIILRACMHLATFPKFFLSCFPRKNGAGSPRCLGRVAGACSGSLCAEAGPVRCRSTVHGTSRRAARVGGA